MPDLSIYSLRTENTSSVCLVGAGTVGRAILGEHLKHRIDVVLIDANVNSLQSACEAAVKQFRELRIERIKPLVGEMPTATMSFGDASAPSIVIESIPENLALKQSLFLDLRQRLGADVILASNTSNLQIASIFEPLGNDPRCCGMHFFMPVADRPLVECVPTASTSSLTKSICQTHATRICKKTLHVRDSPGFVVNRLLAPYLNQSLLMLEHGIDASMLAAAAIMFGMPMSPLQLIDTIGLRTAFDSGRIFWQSFPSRLDPAPILAGMIKARASFYDAVITPSDHLNIHAPLSESAKKVIAKYHRDVRSWSIEEIAQMISIPMWIEAAELMATGLVSDQASIELAMQSGLGYDQQHGFFGYFDSLGSKVLKHQLETTSLQFRGLRAPAELVACLVRGNNPSEAAARYAWSKRGLSS